MVEKEDGQVDDSIILENIGRMSKEFNIPVTVLVGDKKYTGIIAAITSLFGGASHSPILYLRWVDDDDPEKEQHVMIPMNKISYMAFATEKGFLDNLVK